MTLAPTLSLTTPLGRAWVRMKLFLFQPFNLERWFVVGFAAFLAQLGSGRGGGGSDAGLKIGDHWGGNWGWDRHEVQEWPQALERSLEDILTNAWMVALAGFLIFLVLAVTILLIWLSSRGRFVLLDNLVTGQHSIGAPWRKTSAAGQSLFVWQLVFSVVCLLVFGGFVATLVLIFLPLGILGVDGAVAVPLVILLGTLGFLLAITAIYIEFFLHKFVVPIMYKHGLSANQAWARFKPLFSQYPGWFALYGLFYLGVSIAGTLALFLGGLLTCCIGLILLMIPYIGSVVSLPLTVTLRYWDLEFLGQFGPDFQLLGPVPDNPDHRSIYDESDGTVVGSEDLGPDSGGDQAGPENS